MRALREHRMVILGEIHHRPRYWAFNAAHVREANLPARVGRIYLELPVNDQALVDRFLAADTLDSAPMVEMLRDMLWMGGPDQPMLEFFEAVWQVNRHLAPAQRIRVVLVDMARPWREIRKREDWRYGGDWEERMRAEKHAEAARDNTAVLAAARRLFEAIRAADYRRDWRVRNRWREFPAADVSYCVYTDYPAWVDWICGHFKTNPIVSVTLGTVFSDAAGRPVVPYKLTLRDSSELAGELPFRWQPRQGRWEGVEGLDWHRRAKP